MAGYRTKVVCKRCGVEVERRSPNHTYCGPCSEVALSEARGRAEEKRKAKDKLLRAAKPRKPRAPFREQITCERCLKTVTVDTPNQLYCEVCRPVVRREQRRINERRRRKLKREVINRRARERYQTDEVYRAKLIELKKLKSDKVFFRGNRARALERDGYRCRFCGSREALVVHHIDGSGQTKAKDRNNELLNLTTLCRSCHTRHHAVKR